LPLSDHLFLIKNAGYLPIRKPLLGNINIDRFPSNVGY